jgi:CRP/FNR family transcriptional regulator, dissimilatory nitrate respiration regulator
MKTIAAGIDRKIDVMRQCPLFAGVEEGYLREMAETAFLREYAAREILFHQQEQADGFFVVDEGELEVFCAGRDGREQIMHLFTEGDVCGEVPVFQGGVYPASARARIASTVLYIPGDQFLDLAEQHPDILLEMLAMLSRRLRRLVSLATDLSLRDVTSRLAKYLLALPGADDQRSLDCGKAELASRLGTIPETLSRALTKLRTAEMIEVSGSDIRILDVQRLEELAEGGKFAR